MVRSKGGESLWEMPWIVRGIARGARIQESHSVVSNDFQERGKFPIINARAGLHDDLKSNTHKNDFIWLSPYCRLSGQQSGFWITRRLNSLSLKYLTVLMPRIHCVSPLIDLFLDGWELILKELPHDVNVAAIQPIMIDGDGVFLEDKKQVTGLWIV